MVGVTSRRARGMLVGILARTGLAQRTVTRQGDEITDADTKGRRDGCFDDARNLNFDETMMVDTRMIEE